MKTRHRTLDGDDIAIHFYEGDREAFYNWLDEPRAILAFDTETSGLDTYSGDTLRLVQFGDANASWVIPPRYVEEIRRAIASAKWLVAHNAPFDLLNLDHHLGIKLEETHAKTLDTRILSHIIDPRAKHEGGTGHGLKELAAHFVDPDAPDGQSELKAVFRENKWKVAEGWGLVPEDCEPFWVYAGLDTVLTARVYYKLLPLLKGEEKLSHFEHRLQRLLARMERRGVLVDAEYLRGLVVEFDRQEEEAKKIASMYGIEKVGSPAQVAEALKHLGVELTETTATGKLKVDGAILEKLAADGNPVAQAVIDAKRAAKWRSAYAESMLNLRDTNDRVHPKLNGLQARTARMSIARPAWQQLPSSDFVVRDGVIADPGHLIVSSDYSQIEPKVVAALAGCQSLIDATRAGEDLYNATATLVYGEDFTKADRKTAKIVYLAKVYGGGAATQARQTGNTVHMMRKANKEFDAQFPEIRKYGDDLQGEASARERTEVVTPLLGRRLPVDDARVYSATNYMVQSLARDIFAQSMLDMESAGLEEYMLLPVHDENLCQAPADIAEDVAQSVAKAMSTTFMGVPIMAEAEVYGPKWGYGYRTCDQGHGLAWNGHALVCKKCQ